MKQIFRNFIHVTQRFKTASLLNLLGLSLAFAVFIVIALQAYYDFNFNAEFKKSDDIYLLTTTRQTESETNQKITFGTKEMRSMASQFPEIKSYAMAGKQYSSLPSVYLTKPDGSKAKFETEVSQINEAFFDVFTPTILAGDVQKIRTNPNSLMITKSEATKLFGNESPIGKTVQIEIMMPLEIKKKNYISFTQIDSVMTMDIAAVCQDFATNSSLYNGFYIYRDLHKYLTLNVYFEVGKDAIAQLQEKLNSKEVLDEFIPINENDQEITLSRNIKLIPIKNIHFELKGKTERSKDINSVYSLLAIGLVTLIIAYINFINFTTAMAPARVRALNIQKILGANTASLRIIIACEAVLFTLIAFVLSIVFINLLNAKILTILFAADFSLLNNIGFYIGIGAILLIISALIGIYPAYYITSFNAVSALNTSASGGGNKNSKLRSTLITIQYTAAISLIVIALFIKKQHTYMENYSLGINQENILFVQVKKEAKRTSYLDVPNKIFANEVMQSPHILSHTLSQHVPGKGGGENFQAQIMVDNEKKSYKFNSWQVDANFIDFFGLKIVEGSNFSKDASKDKQIVVNQQFIKSHNLTNLLEAELPIVNYKQQTPEGAICDFNSRALQFDIVSCLFYIIPEEININYVFFNLVHDKNQ